MDSPATQLKGTLEVPTSMATFAVETAATVPIFGVAELGLGYARRTATLRNRAVKDTSGGLVRDFIRPIEVQFEYVESYSELLRVLQVSASASYGGVGDAQASASLSMMRSTEIKSNCAYVALKLKVIAKVSYLDSAYLTDEALKVLNQQAPAQFYEKFGSWFIRALYHGGELACVMEFTSESETNTETFRAEIRGQVGVAKAQANVESSVTTLTGGRRVKISCAQTGGVTTGRNGIFPTTPEELISRVRDFPVEVTGTEGKKGNMVPLLADLLNMRAALNWPAHRTDDLDSPYPEGIGNIATSIVVLKEQQLKVESIIVSKALLSPGLREGAQIMKPYLELQITEATEALQAMMNDSRAPTKLEIETLTQYRIRNLLGVGFRSVRDNAGAVCDLSEEDKEIVKAALWGKPDPLPIKPWPLLDVRGRWAFQGQGDEFDWYHTGLRIPCVQHGGNINAEADRFAAKQGPDDFKHIGFAQPFVAPYSDGGTCGYTIIHLTAVTVIEPDANPLPSLPSIPATPADSVSATPGEITNLNGSNWRMGFQVHVPRQTSCGKYELTITQKSTKAPTHTRQTKEVSYWYKQNETNLTLNHPVALDDGWEISSFSVQVGPVYCAD